MSFLSIPRCLVGWGVNPDGAFMAPGEAGPEPLRVDRVPDLVHSLVPEVLGLPVRNDNGVVLGRAEHLREPMAPLARQFFVPRAIVRMSQTQFHSALPTTRVGVQGFVGSRTRFDQEITTFGPHVRTFSTELGWMMPRLTAEALQESAGHFAGLGVSMTDSLALSQLIVNALLQELGGGLTHVRDISIEKEGGDIVFLNHFSRRGAAIEGAHAIRKSLMTALLLTQQLDRFEVFFSGNVQGGRAGYLVNVSIQKRPLPDVRKRTENPHLSVRIEKSNFHPSALWREEGFLQTRPDDGVPTLREVFIPDGSADSQWSSASSPVTAQA